MPSDGRDQDSEVSSAVRLGAAMKAAREAAGISRRQFARKVTWSHSNLADYENGHRVAPVAIVRAYEKELELAPDSLFELQRVASDEAHGKMRERRPRSSSPPSQTEDRMPPIAQPDGPSTSADPGMSAAPDRPASAGTGFVPTLRAPQERARAVRGTVWRWTRRHHPVWDHVEIVDFRYRSEFVERVWSQRVVNGLERWLQHAAEMHLGVRNMPELLKLSYCQSTAEPGETVSIKKAFEQAGRQLLIVGSPGSGKTTQALTLMRDLLATARSDEQAPVPEIFPLSSWAREQKPILEWLAGQVRARHGRPLSEARSLVWHHQIMPVLDGLDEVAPEDRAECVEAINCFWEDRGGGPVVLCCRQAEYQALPQQVKLGGAVTVCPPEPGEVDRYLEAAGPRWQEVRARLRDGTEPDLGELLSTPLMLSIAVLCYQEGDPTELCVGESPGAERDRLWSRYITTVTARNYSPTADISEDPSRYSEEQAQHWLGWLAREMAAQNEAELWLHEWSGSPRWQKGVKIVLGLVVALLFALAYGLAFGYGQKLGPADGLKAGAAIGLGVGIAIWLSFRLNVRPDTADGRRFDRRGLALGLAAGLAVALVVALVRVPGAEKLVDSRHARVPKSLVADLAYALTLGLIGGFTFLLDTGPDRSVRRLFDRRALATGLALGLGVALVVWLRGVVAARLAIEPTFGLAYGLAFLVNVGPAPAYRRPFDRRALAFGSAVGISVGIAMGIAVGLSDKAGNGLKLGLFAAPALGLVGVLVLGLLGVGQERERVVLTSPKQAIRTSGQLGLAFGLLVTVVVGMATGMSAGPSAGATATLVFGLTFGLAYGLAAGLAFGLDAVAFHYAFRFWLRMHRLGPWDWPDFLHWASDRMLLRTNGASYEWLHLELRNHFAQQQRVRLTRGPPTCSR